MFEKVYLSTNPGILTDPFFKNFDLLFRNALQTHSEFKPFSDTLKVPYPMDSWFNEEYLVFEFPILNGKLEDIEVTKTSDMLKIKYTRPDGEDEGKTFTRRNIVRRSFDFEWRVTSKFDSTGIQSVFENGLLTIYIPFAQEARPEKVQILDTAANWKKIAIGQPLLETTESL